MVTGVYATKPYRSSVFIRDCNATGDKNCQPGIPIVFYGNLYRANPLKETTEYIRDNIFALPQVLSAYSVTPLGHGSHGRNPWYNKTMQCDEAARKKYKDNKQEVQCDEYPFFSSNEGGEMNYLNGQVSLRLIDRKETNGQSGLMKTSRLMDAGVLPGNPFYKWYGVVAIPEMNESFWRDRQGKRIN